MDNRRLGNCGLDVSPVGYGAFKIGRNQKIKYAQAYDLPSDDEADRLLNAVLDLGVTYIDTAPAYGLSEQRIGTAISHRKGEFVLSTKVGESFADGESTYDFSADGVRRSVERSLARLKLETLDVVFIHSDGNDQHILNETDVVETLCKLRDAGVAQAIGFSGKSVEGARASLTWADAIMVEYNLDDTSHEPVIAEANAAGVGVVVKKGLASGHLPADEAIRFVLANDAVGSVVVGGLNLEHLRANVAAAGR